MDDDQDDMPEPEDEVPVPMPPNGKPVAYDYTHEDMAEAADRAIALLQPIVEEDIYKQLMRVQFDLDDVISLLKNFKNRVAIHAFANGKLVWRHEGLPQVEGPIDLEKLVKKD